MKTATIPIEGLDGYPISFNIVSSLNYPGLHDESRIYFVS